MMWQELRSESSVTEGRPYYDLTHRCHRLTQTHSSYQHQLTHPSQEDANPLQLSRSHLVLGALIAEGFFGAVYRGVLTVASLVWVWL